MFIWNSCHLPSILADYPVYTFSEMHCGGVFTSKAKHQQFLGLSAFELPNKIVVLFGLEQRITSPLGYIPTRLEIALEQSLYLWK